MRTFKHVLSQRQLPIVSALAGLGLLGSLVCSVPAPEPVESVIVQGPDLAASRAAVLAAGGEITHELGVIRAVGAELSASELKSLRTAVAVRIYDDRSVQSAARPVRTITVSNTKTATLDVVPSESTDTATLDTVSVDGTESAADPVASGTGHVTVVGAHPLHAAGITGAGVTLAVLDTGFFNQNSLSRDTRRKERILAQYDALAGAEVYTWEESDASGHGAHVTGIAINSELAREDRLRRGVAPDATLVVVRAFDPDGSGSYADVIRGIDWLVTHKEEHGIRVLNLSFSAPPQSHYWDDPLNQAVMAAWEAGITVVASAGNTGPEPMTIGVPGNVPYVITVGAMTDNYTPDDPSDDHLANFSSTGPTVEGFVKPELVAPGGHVYGMMHDDSRASR